MIKPTLAATFIALTILATSCASSSGSTAPAVSINQGSVPPIASTQPEPILGTWRMTFTCDAVVRAYDDAGVADAAPKTLVGLHMQGGPPGRLAASADICQGAKQVTRTIIFRSNGYLLAYQGDKQVDDCRCYVLLDDHTFVALGDAVDVSLGYRIEGDTLTFDVVIPDQCSTTQCRDAVAYAAAAYGLGPWQRVK